MSLSEIEEATKEDVTLQKLADLILTNGWDSLNDLSDQTGVNMTELKRFSKISEELTVNDEASIILRGSRIIMPEKLTIATRPLAY